MDRAGRLWQDLDGQAQTGVERWLQQRVALVCRDPWWEEFRTHRRQATGGLASLAPSPEGVTTLYDAFVARQLADPELLRRRYPVAAALVGTAVSQWVDAVVEWLHRLEGDRELLDATFAGGSVLGRVVDVEAGLSDPHHNGRDVMIVHFSTGERVVYKPRPVRLDVEFHALLGHLNGWGMEPKLLTLDAVDRGSYGWVQRIAPEPCPDLSAATRFYERAGALLAVVCALRARDQHAANMIAAGEHPVLIDAELLLDVATQWSTPRPGEGALFAVGQELAESVLASAMLPGSSPAWGVDFSALGGVSSGQLPTQSTFIHTNTDRMDAVERSARRGGQANAVRLGDVVLQPADHAGALLHGFARAYRLIHQHVAAVHEWLGRLGDADVRFLYRGTAAYGKVLRSSLSAGNLRDDTVRETTLRQLRRPFDTGLDDPDWRPLCEFEENALRRLDIPLLSAGAVTGAVSVDGVGTGLTIDVPPIALTARRLERLGDADLQRQSAFVRAALLPPLPAVEPGTSLRAASREELTAAVHDIAARLAASAIRHEDGSAAWFDYVETGRAGTIRPMTSGLYRGADGVALFLAAAARTVGADSTGLAGAATAPVLRDLAEGGLRIAREVALGLDGLGGVVYSLAQLSRLLQDERYLDAARQAAALVDHGRLASDREGDVLSGAAGVVLGLLSLHDLDPDGPGLTRAIEAGDHLLDLDPPTAQTAMIGLKHLGIGRALALFGLHRVTGQQRFLDRAGELAAEEDDRLEVTVRGAPGTSQEAVGTVLCPGALGATVVSRWSWERGDDRRQRTILARATDAVERSGLLAADAYCCGNAGSIDALVVAGREHAAWSLAGAVLDRAAKGGFRLPGAHSGADASNGAFLGLAGVGLAFLRCLDPDEVPLIGAMT